MFWLTEEGMDDICHNINATGDTSSYTSPNFWHFKVAKAQLKKFWEWGNEVCIIHQRHVCRLDCQQCIKNIKKELGL